MSLCWMEHDFARPTFTALKVQMEKLYGEATSHYGYVHLYSELGDDPSEAVAVEIVNHDEIEVLCL